MRWSCETLLAFVYAPLGFAIAGQPKRLSLRELLSGII
jgi:hypothetical protein